MHRDVQESDGRQATFLAELGRGLSVTGAAAAAGINRGLAYRWRETDPVFAAAWRMAAQAAADLLEDQALRRAVEGVEKPVFHRGEQVGVVRTYNDRLLMWLLQRRQSALQPAESDLRKALEEADAYRQEMTCRLDRANERIAELNRELLQARRDLASVGLCDDVSPFADEDDCECRETTDLDARKVDEDAWDDDTGDVDTSDDVPSATSAASRTPSVSKCLPASASPPDGSCSRPGVPVAAGGTSRSDGPRPAPAELRAYSRPPKAFADG